MKIDPEKNPVTYFLVTHKISFAVLVIATIIGYAMFDNPLKGFLTGLVLVLLGPVLDSLLDNEE